MSDIAVKTSDHVVARERLTEDWLSVAIGVLVFALALSDPQSSLLSGLASHASGQTHVILVLDGSYSMDCRASEKSRFQIAKELARQRVREAR